MYEAQAWRLVRRLARRAGIKSAGQLSPHSLRHTYATSLDYAGVALQDIQDAMGHADPRTTRRYMASHQHLDRHATYAFAAWLRRTPDNPDQPPATEQHRRTVLLDNRRCTHAPLARAALRGDPSRQLDVIARTRHVLSAARRHRGEPRFPGAASRG